MERGERSRGRCQGDFGAERREGGQKWGVISSRIWCLDLLQGFEAIKGKHIGLCFFNGTSPLRLDYVYSGFYTGYLVNPWASWAEASGVVTVGSE